MKVNVLTPDDAFIALQREELESLLKLPTDLVSRPCPDCTIPCPCSGASDCPCHCSSECEFAPRKMSSEPERFPIEPRIAALVYALYTTGVTAPCWSCEGHFSEDGRTVACLPQVWFYARSALYPRLMAEHVDSLLFRRKIHHTWCVRVLSWSNTFDTRYCIEPVVPVLAEADLRALQRESKVIGAALNEQLHHGAQVQLKNLPQ